MARTATKSAEPKKKKKTAAAAGAGAPVKAKKDKSSGKSAKKAAKVEKIEKKASTKERGGLDGLAKLVDHPLVADLLAAGAIAAVAAIAEHQLGAGKGQSSSKMVKSVGKAAAAAMGKKLMGDFGAIGEAAADAAKKA